MSNLALKMNDGWPDAVKSTELSINDGVFAFADIYLRNAPCYLKGLMLQARGDVKGKLRGPDAGLLAFEDGACDVSASSLFLTVAMAATDEAALSDMQAYIENKLRTMSPQTRIDFDWRNK